MKFKKLTIHNIASIEDAEIDFEGDVLRDEPLFLITGATGAGKTTILDAICLALYGDTPRMVDGAGKSEQVFDTYNASRGKGEKKDIKVQEMSLNHKGQLLRRGTYEAWAILSFEADDKEYVAQWTVGRANRRADGKFKSPENSLEDLTTHQVWKKRAEFSEKIREVVGLSFDEFRRTTMLAQGEFARFLQCKADERSAILEKLTHTEIYSRISQKIHEEAKVHEDHFNRANDRLSDIHPLSEEELSQRKEALAKAEDKKQESDRRLKTLQEQCQWMTDEQRLTATLAEKQQSLQQLHLEGTTPQFIREKSDIADYALTIQPRTWIGELDRLKEDQVSLDADIQTMKKQYADLTHATSSIYRHQEDDIHQRDLVSQWLAAREADMPMWENAPAIVEILRQVRAEQKVAAEKAESARRGRQKLPDVEKDVETARIAELSAKEEVEKQRQTLSGLQQQRDAKQPDDVQRQSKSLNAQRVEIAAAATAIGLLDTYRQNLQKAVQDLQAVTQRQQMLLQEAPSLAEKVAERRKEADDAQLIYDQWHESLEDSFIKVRMLLRRGQTCPLCMQEINKDYVPDPDFEAVLQPVISRRNECRDQLAQAEAARTANVNLQEECGRQISLLEKQCQKTESSFLKQLSEANTVYVKAVSPFTHITHDPVPAMPQDIAHDSEETTQRCLAFVQQVDGWVEEQQKVVEKRWNDILALGRTIDKASEELDRRQRLYGQAQRAVADAQNVCTDLRQRIINDESQSKEYLQQIERKMTELDGRISYPEWRQEWENDSDELMRRLLSDAGAYNAKKEALARLTQDVENRKVTLGHISDITQSLAQRAPFLLEGEIPASEKSIPESQVAKNWQQLDAGVSVWMTRVEHLKKTEKEKQSLLTEFLDSHPSISRERLLELVSVDADWIARLETRHQEYDRRLIMTEGEVASLKQQYSTHIQQRPELDEGVTIESLTQTIEAVNAEREQVTTEMGRIQGELDENKKVLQRFEKAIAERDELRMVRDKWKRFDGIFGSSDGKKFRTIAQSFILHHLLERANRYLRQLTDRYELTCRPGAITIYVNDRFSVQGAQSAKVLSGGETFLASLSLALALSHLNPGSTNFGILFIDEGFGTLDEESLNMVMDTLGQLHQIGGRRVGIISHIDALEERIHTQIKVVRVDATKSRVEVVG